MNEGRASSESFNVSYYLANNSDLRAAGFNNQQAHPHFEINGFRERRLGAASAQGFLQVDPGNNLGNAFSLDVLNGDRSIKQFVGSSDRDDYYRFTLASTSNLSLSLNGLKDSANMQLIFDSNSNGLVDYSETLDQEYGYSNYNASISSPLGAGTYFIHVYTDYFSYNTNYTLGLSATIALRTYIRTLLERSINTITKVIELIPLLSQPIFWHKPPVFNLVQVRCFFRNSFFCDSNRVDLEHH